MVREHKSVNPDKIAAMPRPWVAQLSALSFIHLQSHLCRMKQASLSSEYYAHFSVMLTILRFNWDRKAFSLPQLAGEESRI